MAVFIDTSAFFAILDAGDAHSEEAGQIWRDLVIRDEVLVSNNYVILETVALLQHRLGMEAVRDFSTRIAPLLQVDWIDSEKNERAMELLVSAGRRRLSLVDCTSFGTMRRLEIQIAFSFDRHFQEQGFTCLPA